LEDPQDFLNGLVREDCVEEGGFDGPPKKA
jgi:hypothetical protein